MVVHSRTHPAFSVHPVQFHAAKSTRVHPIDVSAHPPVQANTLFDMPPSAACPVNEFHRRASGQR
ncbi:hypothetical protein FA95DRAFT_1568026 [Auriscalpium vulgare]|uniref:Uncharacterized protein n=1 Tax=Auriscalpium vulgare TaxID=40419 RepID=A0ACB8R1I1_9AGAM|nr:hypothetical protein FA95DRAFT_1568026 [Auriscalpium vulgare]